MKTRAVASLELKEKLSTLECKEDRLDLIWTWSVQKVINRRQFKELINSI